MPVESPWDGTFEEFVRRAPDGVTYPIEQVSVEATHAMLSMLRKRGVRVVLVAPPEWVGVQRYELNRGELFGMIEGMARQHGADFLDYSDQPISRRKELFFNPRHLTAKGAAEFSHLFARDLQRLLSQPAPTSIRLH